MNYCFNPDCQNPLNQEDAQSCHTCGSSLLLKNRYRILETLGQGSLSRTFLAIDEDKPSHPRCVIQQFIVRDPGTGNQITAQKFREAAVRLDELGKYPQIPELLASFEESGGYYWVHEYIEGQNLAQELAEEGAFNETKIRALLKSLLITLQFVHSKGLIHQDIKPENIIRRAHDGEFVLVDFGAAKYVSGQHLINSSNIRGTAEYAAPEQTKGKAIASSDLYSVGVTCIHLLTQLSAFDLFDTKAETWVWQHYLKAKDSSQSRAAISPQIARLLDKLVQRDPKQRYQSAAEALKALTDWPLVSDIVPRKVRWSMAAFGGAAIAILLTNLQGRAPYPVPQTSFAPSQPLRTLPEVGTIPYHMAKKMPPMQTLVKSAGPIWSLAVTPDGQTLLSGTTDGTIQVWQMGNRSYEREPGSLLRLLNGHSRPVWALAVSPNGKLLASGSGDKTIKLWNLETGDLLGTFAGHGGGVFSLAFSPDGKFLASVGEDKAIKLWRISPGSKYGQNSAIAPMRILISHTDAVQSVAFSPDGQMLVSGSSDGTVKLWNWRSGELMRTLIGHTDGVWSVGISPDNQTVASGSWDNTVKLWNLNTGELERTLVGHSDKVQSVAFSPDGRTLASSDFSGTIKLWQLNTGGVLGTLKGHSSWAKVTFNPRGKSLISASFDDTIKLWSLCRY